MVTFANPTHFPVQLPLRRRTRIYPHLLEVYPSGSLIIGWENMMLSWLRADLDMLMSLTQQWRITWKVPSRGECALIQHLPALTRRNYSARATGVAFLLDSKLPEAGAKNFSSLTRDLDRELAGNRFATTELCLLSEYTRD